MGRAEAEGEAGSAWSREPHRELNPRTLGRDRSGRQRLSQLGHPGTPAYRIVIVMSLCVGPGASPYGFTQFLGFTGLWFSKLGEILAIIS